MAETPKPRTSWQLGMRPRWPKCFYYLLFYLQCILWFCRSFPSAVDIFFRCVLRQCYDQGFGLTWNHWNWIVLMLPFVCLHE